MTLTFANGGTEATGVSITKLKSTVHKLIAHNRFKDKLMKLRDQNLREVDTEIHDAASPIMIRKRSNSLTPLMMSSRRERISKSSSFGDITKENMFEELRTKYNVDEDSTDPFGNEKYLLLRESIRFSPRIRSLITMVWLAADDDSSGRLDKEEYLMLNQKLQVAVIGDYDRVQGKQLAEEDWAADSKGNDHLTYSSFSQSWFELVDMWTDGVSEEIYFQFLYQLVQRMICKNDDGALCFRINTKIPSQESYEKQHLMKSASDIFVPPTPLETRKLYGKKTKKNNKYSKPLRKTNKKKDAFAPKQETEAKYESKDKSKAAKQRMVFQMNVARFGKNKNKHGDHQIPSGTRPKSACLYRPAGSKHQHDSNNFFGCINNHYNQNRNSDMNSTAKERASIDKIVELKKPSKNVPYVYNGVSLMPFKEQAILERKKRNLSDEREGRQYHAWEAFHKHTFIRQLSS